MNGLGGVWPASRTKINGVSLGDAWPCSSMPGGSLSQPWENVVPFHKLTQWLCYSLMEPMSRLLQIKFAGTELLTGLPEYRNGGLLVDTGLLTLKENDAKRGLVAFRTNSLLKGQQTVEVIPLFTTDDDVIVEWRAVTIGFLDELLVEVNGLLGLTGSDQLTLAQMLEAGTWKVSVDFFETHTRECSWYFLRREVENSPKSPGPTPRNHQSSLFRMALYSKSFV